MSKKNCYHCEFAEYEAPDSYVCDSGGWSCNKRQYKSDIEEYRHLDQMNDPDYLERAKKCFESKGGAK
jgi:hypothetical protein